MSPMQTADPWYKEIETTKEKARKLMKKIIAINQSTSIVVGTLETADVDRLGPAHNPSCKIVLSNPKRFSVSSGFQFKKDDEGVYFVNKSQLLMDMKELEQAFPKIFEEVHLGIKKGVWDGN